MENVDTQRGGPGSRTLEGTVLAGRYRLAQVLSSGANTVIMDAIDLENDAPVTVKVVRPEHARDPLFRRKFRRLAEISQALTHPNIASVTDWGEIELRGDSTVFWVVDALGGGSLRDLLDRGRLLEPGQALIVGLEACRALDAAHHKGLFHTELTPSKMVFGADRRLRVVDFGMARLLAEPAWADATAVPTHVARYASPEQALGLPIDAKTDVYALALVLVEAVTGSVPFAADSTVATLAARVDRLLPVSADLGSLASVLERAGRPESSDRFTAAEFGRALVKAAPRLPKPEPIPILASGMFDTATMRRPTDPTGGVERPAPVAGLAGVDEGGVRAASARRPSDPADGVDRPRGTAGPGAAAAGAAAAGAVATAGGAATASSSDTDSATESEGEPEPEPDVPEVADASTVPELETEPDVSTEPVPEEIATTETEPEAVAETETDTEADQEPEPDTEPEPDPEPDAATEPDPEPEPDPEADPEPEPEAGTESDAPVEPDTESDPEPEAVTESETKGETETEVDTIDSVAAPSQPEAPAAGEEAAVVVDVDDRTDVMPIANDPTSVIPASAASTDSSGPQSSSVRGGELYDDAPSRRRRGPIIVLVLLLLAGVGALAYAGSLLLQTKSFEVPVLAGVSEQQALDQISGNDWDLETIRERSDSFPEPDTVIRTVPGAGVELDEGETFTLVLSDGPEFRQLPDLDGVPFNAAVTELAGLGLIGIESAEREFSETVPVESVTSWQVEGDSGAMQAGAQILPGETIVMTLSKGPEPRTVPDLAGRTVEAATAALDDLRLELEQGDQVFSDTVPSGQIVSQEPAAGTSMERDGTVTVRVSKGPDVIELPDLEGLEFAEARTALVDAGFTIGSLLGTTEGTFVEASVDGDAVPPGEVLRRGTTVDLIFL